RFLSPPLLLSLSFYHSYLSATTINLLEGTPSGQQVIIVIVSFSPCDLSIVKSLGSTIFLFLTMYFRVTPSFCTSTWSPISTFSKFEKIVSGRFLFLVKKLGTALCP